MIDGDSPDCVEVLLESPSARVASTAEFAVRTRTERFSPKPIMTPKTPPSRKRSNDNLSEVSSRGILSTTGAEIGYMPLSKFPRMPNSRSKMSPNTTPKSTKNSSPKPLALSTVVNIGQNQLSSPPSQEMHISPKAPSNHISQCSPSSSVKAPYQLVRTGIPNCYSTAKSTCESSLQPLLTECGSWSRGNEDKENNCPGRNHNLQKEINYCDDVLSEDEDDLLDDFKENEDEGEECIYRGLELERPNLFELQEIKSNLLKNKIKRLRSVSALSYSYDSEDCTSNPGVLDLNHDGTETIAKDNGCKYKIDLVPRVSCRRSQPSQGASTEGNFKRSPSTGPKTRVPGEVNNSSSDYTHQHLETVAESKSSTVDSVSIESIEALNESSSADSVSIDSVDELTVENLASFDQENNNKDAQSVKSSATGSNHDSTTGKDNSSAVNPETNSAATSSFSYIGSIHVDLRKSSSNPAKEYRIPVSSSASTTSEPPRFSNSVCLRTVPEESLSGDGLSFDQSTALQMERVDCARSKSSFCKNNKVLEGVPEITTFPTVDETITLRESKSMVSNLTNPCPSGDEGEKKQFDKIPSDVMTCKDYHNLPFNSSLSINMSSSHDSEQRNGKSIHSNVQTSDDYRALSFNSSISIRMTSSHDSEDSKTSSVVIDKDELTPLPNLKTLSYADSPAAPSFTTSAATSSAASAASDLFALLRNKYSQEDEEEGSDQQEDTSLSPPHVSCDTKAMEKPSENRKAPENSSKSDDGSEATSDILAAATTILKESTVPKNVFEAKPSTPQKSATKPDEGKFGSETPKCSTRATPKRTKQRQSFSGLETPSSISKITPKFSKHRQSYGGWETPNSTSKTTPKLKNQRLSYDSIGATAHNVIRPTARAMDPTSIVFDMENSAPSSPEGTPTARQKSDVGTADTPLVNADGVHEDEKSEGESTPFANIFSIDTKLLDIAATMEINAISSFESTGDESAENLNEWYDFANKKISEKKPSQETVQEPVTDSAERINNCQDTSSSQSCIQTSSRVASISTWDERDFKAGSSGDTRHNEESEELRKQLKLMKMQLDAEIRLKEEAREKILTLTKDLDTLKDGNKNVEECLQHRIKYLESQLGTERTKRERSTLDVKVALAAARELEMVCHIRMKEVEEISKVNAELLGREKELETSLISCVKDNDSLRRNLLSMAEDCTTKEKTLAIALTQLKSLSETFYHVKESLKIEKDEKDALQWSIDDISRQMLKMSEQVHALETENDGLRGEVKRLKTEGHTKINMCRAARGY